MSCPPAALERRATSGLVLLWLLTGYIALQPLSTDFYLPALPGMASSFGTSVAIVQLTLTLYIAVFGIAQLFVGPLADRVGRLPVLAGGIALYTFASFCAVLAPTVEWLIAARVGQALGACSGIVGARAIIRDRFPPADGARILASANAMMSVLPLVGPVIGGMLAASFGHRSIFAVVTLISAALLWLTVRHLTETNRAPNRHATALTPMLRNYWQILRHPAFQAYALSQTTTYAGVFAFLSGSPFVFIEVLGMTPQRFGLCFAITVIGYVIGSLACKHMLNRFGVRRTLMFASCLSVSAGLLMLVLALGGAHSAWAILMPQFLYVMGHGLLTPCAQAGSISPFPSMAGAASALMGFMLAAAGVVTGTIMGLTFNNTVYPLVITIAGAAVMLGIVAWTLVRRHGHIADA
ncbi:MAG TPA: multidrug effflux MFS transporter [Burkholderiaceae bacterium]|nr:multidrug effflux MFS transporter [Burkholderiaceae bacterium]